MHQKTSRQYMMRLFLALFLLLFASSYALTVIDADIKNELAPYGIFSFEFCGFNGDCVDIVNSWGDDARQSIMLMLGLDYLYLFLYPGLLALTITLIPKSAGCFPAIPNNAVWFLCGLISIFDALENYLLIQMVRLNDVSADLLNVFVALKFGILFLMLAWLLWCFILFMWSYWGANTIKE